MNSRQKGNRGEREALKLLKQWWGGEPWDRRSMGQKGDDLIATPLDFPWSVEVKNSAAVKCRHFFTPSSDLKSWWSQAVSQAGDRPPLLLMKVERKWYAAYRGDATGPNCTVYLGGQLVNVQLFDAFAISHKQLVTHA